MILFLVVGSSSSKAKNLPVHLPTSHPNSTSAKVTSGRCTFHLSWAMETEGPVSSLPCLPQKFRGASWSQENLSSQPDDSFGIWLFLDFLGDGQFLSDPKNVRILRLDGFEHVGMLHRTSFISFWIPIEIQSRKILRGKTSTCHKYPFIAVFFPHFPQISLCNMGLLPGQDQGR